MNRTIIKNYAPKARREFIAAVTAKANMLGITRDHIAEAKETGDYLIVDGRPLPAKIAPHRQALVAEIERKDFDEVIEEAAYTWFNRFVALRYMELHNLLPLPCPLLGGEDNTERPAILNHVVSLDESMFPQNVIARARELALAGDKEEELFALLLIAQCNKLHSAMPLLFERVSDASELLLPGSLLRADSLVRKLVKEIPDEEWDSVEIVGWLYQYYIQEKKDAVIGKVVATRDIPAATQLFTPNWIVQYMVQNTLGRLWLMAKPSESLKKTMPYYIEPAEQSPEVNEALEEIRPLFKKIEDEEDRDYKGIIYRSLADIHFLDPACGSGHILVETYNIFKTIYTHLGYRRTDFPRLILENNLFGLDIDHRAAQMTQFALLMLACKDDKSLLANPPKMNVLALRSSGQLYVAPPEEPRRRRSRRTRGVAQAEAAQLSLPGLQEGQGSQNAANSMEAFVQKLLQAAMGAGSKGKLVSEADPFSGQMGETSDGEIASRDDIVALLELFADADTFGSLIRIPENVKNSLPRLRTLLEAAFAKGDVVAQENASILAPLVRQADLLSRQYDCVVANPPYMGSRNFNEKLKAYASEHYSDSKTDLYAMFIERCCEMTRTYGYVGMVTMHGFMFLKSYEQFRSNLLLSTTIETMAHLGPRSFDSIGGEVVQTTAFTLINKNINDFKSLFYRLTDYDSEKSKEEAFLSNKLCQFITTSQGFTTIPGSPFTYWVSDKIRSVFASNTSLRENAKAVVGLQTGDNEQFLRLWFELEFSRIGFSMSSSDKAKESKFKWFPHNKGGTFRKWYGNQDYVVDWEDDGYAIKHFVDNNSRLRSRPQNTEYYFDESISWTDITSGSTVFRYYPKGFIFDSCAPAAFEKTNFNNKNYLCYLNNKFVNYANKIINPTFHFRTGYFDLLPNPKDLYQNANIEYAERLIDIARIDWDYYETSWNFKNLPLLTGIIKPAKLEELYTNARANWQEVTEEMQRLEVENNKYFIDAYGLKDELTPDVPLKEITLTCNPWYRYGEDAEGADEATRDRVEARLCSDTIKELISYAIGCMMGRYSLDAEGLIYAGAGNKGFDASKYASFPADEDAIVPLMDLNYFEDDAAHRFTSFLEAALGKEHLDENLQFVASGLDPRANELPTTTIRRWLSSKFYKDWHLKTYRKRPIYWLFSSGKNKAFEALVYLHRYDSQTTLATMRTKYVIPLQGKIADDIRSREDRLESQEKIPNRTDFRKELEVLKKKQMELRAFDELLRHYTEQHIELDLDDGVKVNYAKLGKLLAETKDITGSKGD